MIIKQRTFLMPVRCGGAVAFVLGAWLLLTGCMLLPAYGQDTKTPAAPAVANGAAPSGEQASGRVEPNGQANPAAAQPQPGSELNAQPPPTAAIDALFPPEITRAVRQQEARIDGLAKTVERVRDRDEQLEALRPEIIDIEADALRIESLVAPHLARIERLISQLGARPKDGEVAEAPGLAGERARLEQALQALVSAKKRAGLTQERARQLIQDIQTWRLANLRRDLGTRQAKPLTADYWHDVAKGVPRFMRQLETVALNWWAIAAPRLHWFLLVILSAVGIWWGLRRFGKRTLQQWMQEPLDAAPPAYLSRVRMAVWALPFLLAPGALAAGYIYGGLWVLDLFNSQIDGLAWSALKLITLFLVITTLAKSILLPWTPSWRLIGVPTADARLCLWLTKLLAGVYCLDHWLNETFTALQVAPAIGTAAGFITNIAFAVLLFLFAWLPATRAPNAAGAAAAASGPAVEQDGYAVASSHKDAAHDEGARVSGQLLRRGLLWLRLPATLAVIAILIATLLGYLALGRFMAGQVMLIGVSIAAVLLGHLAARALAGEPEEFAQAGKQASSPQQQLTNQRRQQTLGVLAFLLNAVLVLAAAGLLMLSWGFSGAQLFGWASSLLFGFEVGTFRFSLLQILIAIALFAVIIGATRFMRGWLSRRVLTADRVDRGIANSIDAGVGYAGIAVAGLVGISYAGLDLSNVALIASALSIGIGFGLNAIASNFVSGLIMLIERPIKVGDWVVVGAHQGYVRRISVRATEIETFDRASVIIPNSDFMTSPVQNWTHRNSMGRVLVTIGASYKADPKRVMAVLEQVAAECETFLKYPAPSVHFEEFGASSLDFSIRGFIADVNTILSTKTALRLAIAEAFEQAGIEIPYPQQDVHLRDLDGVREMIALAMAQRAAEARAKQTVAPGNDNSDK